MSAAGDANLTAKIRIIEENSQAIQQAVQKLSQLIIQLKGVNAAAQQAETSFNELGVAIGGSAGPLGEIEARSKNVLNAYNQLNNQVSILSSTHKTFSSQLPSTGAAIDLVAQKTKSLQLTNVSLTDTFGKIGSSIATSVAAYSAAAISVFSLYNAYDNLEKIQLKVNRTALASEKAQTRLASLQATLAAAQEKGNINATKAAVMQERIKNAQEQVTLSQEAAAIAAGDYNETLAGFAFQVVPFVVTAGISVITMLSTLSAANVHGTATTVLLTQATHGLSQAFRTLVMSNLPLLAATLAVTAVIGAFATNLFGLRDAINGIGVAIGRALPFLRPFLDFLGGIGRFISGTAAEVDESSSDIENSITEMSEASSTSINKLSGSVSSLGYVFDKFASQAAEKLEKFLTEREELEIKPKFLLSSDQIKAVNDKLKTLNLEPMNLTVGIETPPDLGKVITEPLDQEMTKVVDNMNAGFVKALADTGVLAQTTIRKIILMLQDDNLKIKLFDEDIGTHQFKILDTELTALAKTLGVSKEQALAVVEAFAKDRWSDQAATVKVFKGNVVELNGAIIPLVDNTNELSTVIDLLKASHVNFFSTLGGGTQQLGVYSNTVAMLKDQYAGNELALEGLNKILKDTNDEARIQTQEYVNTLDDLADKGADITSFAKLTVANIGEINSTFDDSSDKFNAHKQILSEWLEDNNISTQQAQKFWLDLSKGQGVAIAGMDESTQKSVQTLNDMINGFIKAGDGGLALKEVLRELLIELLDLDKGEKDIIATTEDFRKVLKDLDATSAAATDAFNSSWSEAREILLNFTNPKDIDRLIERIEVLKKTEGITPEQILYYEMWQDKLKVIRGMISDVSSEQISLTSTALEQATAMGVQNDELETYISLAETAGYLTDDQILKLQGYTMAAHESNDVLLTQEELQIRLNQAHIKTGEDLKNLEAQYLAERDAEEQELEVLGKLVEKYQIELPQGMELTAELADLLIRKQLGLADAAQKVDKYMADQAGGLTAFQKAEKELTDKIEENARALGVSYEMLVRYNKAKNNLGIVEAGVRNEMIKATAAAYASGNANKYNAMTAETMKVATQTAEARFAAFTQTVSVEAVETARYAQLLAQALIQMGMAASQAYALVAQSISAGEQAYRNLAGVPGVEMPELDMGGGGGGGGGGGESQKQEIDKEAIREQAIQDAIDEAAAVDHLVDKLIDETEAIHDLGLEVGVSRKEMEDFVDDTNEFGIATERARIEMLRLIEAEAKHLDFLTSSTDATKDYLRANIEGTLAANDFTREMRMSLPALEAQRDQLISITKLLGISLPASLEPTVENLENLIAAAYGSEEAMEALKDSVLEVGEFYRDVIEDAKQAITDANFEEFVKKELLFEDVGDEFFRNITRELQAEMKLDEVAEQMKKQLALIQLNPDTFQMNVNPEELRSGVISTLQTIEDAVAGNERLTTAWQPIVDALQGALASPDIHNAIQGFADMFPNLIEPALTGVDFALQGIDTTIEQTFDDTANQQAQAYSDTIERLDELSDDLYDDLLEEAEAANEASESFDNASESVGDYWEKVNDALSKQGELNESFTSTQGILSEAIVGYNEYGVAVGASGDAVLEWFGTGGGVPTQFYTTADGMKVAMENSAAGIDTALAKIPPSATTNAEPVEGIFSEAFTKANIAAVGQISLMLADITKSFGYLKENVTKELEEISKSIDTIFIAAMKKAADDSMTHTSTTSANFVTMRTSINGSVGLIVTTIDSFVNTTMSTMASEGETHTTALSDAFATLADEVASSVDDMISEIDDLIEKLEELAEAQDEADSGGGGMPSGWEDIGGWQHGGRFLINKETHLKVGEGNRPEIVTVTPLSSDAFRNNGLTDRSLGLFSSDRKEPQVKVSTELAPMPLSASNVSSGSSGSRTITLNINQPIVLNGREIGRNVVSQSFDDVDNQH